MNFKSHSLAGFNWLILVLLLASSQGFAEENSFKAMANQAFAEKNYRKALEYYQKVEISSQNDRVLAYNIGVSHYRLGQYIQAEAHFQKAIKKNPNNTLAFLNLGLAQVKLNKIDNAKHSFEKVLQLGASDKIIELAETMLQRIQNEKRKTTQSEDKWPFILSMNLGYQDQAESITDEATEDQTDAYLQLMGIYYQQLNNDYKNGFGFSATAFGLFYDKQKEYNLTMLALSLDKSKTFNSWLTKLGVEANELNLDKSAFQLNTYLYGSLRYPWKRNLLWKLKLRGGYVYALDKEYDYLKGRQHNVYSSLRYRKEKQSFTTFLEYEYNDRKDIDESGFISSQSPERYRLKLDYRIRYWLPWEVRFLAEYRRSVYPGEYQSQPDIETKKRKEDKHRIVVGVNRQLGENLTLLMEFEYVDNYSTIKTYSYYRKQFALGLEYIN